MICFITNLTFSQGGDEFAQCELNFQIFNNSYGLPVDFVVTPVYNTINYKASTTYFAQHNSCNYIPAYPNGPFWFDDPEIQKTISLAGTAVYCVDNGFHYGYSVGAPGSCSQSRSYFQSGLYHVVVKISEYELTNFYYDNRHSQFPSNPCSLSGWFNNDIGVRYDVENDILYYRAPPNSNPNLLDGWNRFKKGEVINWWEIGTHHGSQNFTGFNNGYFSVLNPPVSVNSTPYITWQAPNVAKAIDHYKLQRSWGSDPFLTIYTTTSNLSYYDYEIFWNPNSPNNNQFIQYRLVTVYQDQVWPYEYSNIHKLFVDRNLQKEKNDIKENIIFSLQQNYPNPFNPSTIISYQIPEDVFITLKVYNALGEELKTLVAEFKTKGSYSIDFNADELPSGIYFYRLSAGTFNQSHKMILTK